MRYFWIARYKTKKSIDTNFPQITRAEYEAVVEADENLIWEEDVVCQIPRRVFKYAEIERIPKVCAFFVDEYDKKGDFYRMSITCGKGYVNTSIQIKATLDRLLKLKKIAEQLGGLFERGRTKIVDEAYLLKKIF